MGAARGGAAPRRHAALQSPVRGGHDDHATDLARYRAILASTLDPVIVIDAHGTIQSSSDSLERVFGWRPAEVAGRNVSVLMPEPHRSAHDGYLAEYRRTGRTSIMGRPRELEAVRRDGTEFPIELCISRADLPGGEMLFVGIIRDITRSKQAEQAWQESERRFREMLESVEMVGVMADRDGAIVFCNDCLLRLTGWRRESVLGRSWPETFVPPDGRDAVRSILREAIEQGRVPPRYESEILTRSGERRLIAWNLTVMRDLGGNAVGTAGLGSDITERRRAEEGEARQRERLQGLVAERTHELEASHAQLRLADRLASIGTLAAGIGHDLNNILLPLRCRLDALDAAALPQAAAEHFAAVRRSIDYLQQLADGLHLLALDPDDVDASTQGTDLSEWWDQVGPLLGRGVPKTVRLATSWPSDLPQVAVPPHRLTQAVLNRVVNAGEAVGSEGKVRIWAERDGDGVRLGVTDNGCGMTPQVRRRAFDPFFTTKKRGLGTGLGLSLVQGVARSAGGRVEVDSEPGKGTTIVLTLPAWVPPKRGAADAQDPGPGAVVSVADPRLRSLVASMLRSAGFAVSADAAEVPRPGAAWVTEPSPTALEQARRFVRRGGGRIILLGRGPGEWERLGAIAVEDPEDFEVLRQRIQELVQPSGGAVRA